MTFLQLVAASTMRCPFCGKDNDAVRDSRLVEDGRAIRRRRNCNHCRRRFTTYERVEGLLQVRKRDGTCQDFSRSKIERGLTQACWKRKVKAEELQRLSIEIESHILDHYEREVPSEDIGNLCMERLRGLDEVAFVRFASVYRRFSDAQDFVKELTPILSPDPTQPPKSRRPERPPRGPTHESE
ncbi:MAG: transcriptional regulator NrdR [Planctomycetota bacterium]